MKKSSLKDLVIATGITGSLVALAFGLKEIDRVNGGTQLYTSYALENKTVFDRNKNGISDYIRITTPATNRGFALSYIRPLTKEETCEYYELKGKR